MASHISNSEFSGMSAWVLPLPVNVFTSSIFITLIFSTTHHSPPHSLPTSSSQGPTSTLQIDTVFSHFLNEQHKCVSEPYRAEFLLTQTLRCCSTLSIVLSATRCIRQRSLRAPSISLRLAHPLPLYSNSPLCPTATKVDSAKTKSKAPASSGATNVNLGPAFGELDDTRRK